VDLSLLATATEATRPGPTPSPLHALYGVLASRRTWTRNPTRYVLPPDTSAEDPPWARTCFHASRIFLPHQVTPRPNRTQIPRARQKTAASNAYSSLGHTIHDMWTQFTSLTHQSLIYFLTDPRPPGNRLEESQSVPRLHVTSCPTRSRRAHSPICCLVRPIPASRRPGSGLHRLRAQPSPINTHPRERSPPSASQSHRFFS
jgi:hypothetical protein